MKYLLHSCSVDLCQALDTGYSCSLGWNHHSHTSWYNHCYMWTVLGPPYRIHHTEGHGSYLNSQFWSSSQIVKRYESPYMLSLLWDQMILWAPGQSRTGPLHVLEWPQWRNCRQRCRIVLFPAMIIITQQLLNFSPKNFTGHSCSSLVKGFDLFQTLSWPPTAMKPSSNVKLLAFVNGAWGSRGTSDGGDPYGLKQ